MISIMIKTILLIVFNVCFYTLPKVATGLSMWISYGFIHFAFFMFFLSPLFSKKDGKSKYIASLSLELVNVIYFSFTLLAGVFFLYYPMLSFVQYGVESFITGVYLIILILTVSLNNQIAKNERVASGEKAFINAVYVKLEVIKNMYPELKNINELQELIKYSPVKSSVSVKSLEENIMALLSGVSESGKTSSEGELSEALLNVKNLITQRNLLLKKDL